MQFPKKKTQKSLKEYLNKFCGDLHGDLYDIRGDIPVRPAGVIFKNNLYKFLQESLQQFIKEFFEKPGEELPEQSVKNLLRSLQTNFWKKLWKFFTRNLLQKFWMIVWGYKFILKGISKGIPAVISEKKNTWNNFRRNL